MLLIIEDINFEPILKFSIFGTYVPPPYTQEPSGGVGIKRIGVIRKRIGIGIFMIHIRFLLTGTEYFKMVFLFVSTESEYFILVFLLKENEFNILTELFV